MIVYLAISAAIWYVLAADNAERIEEGKKINHAFNGGIHFTIAGLAGILFGWEHTLSSLCFSRVAFDVLLSHHRELPIDYVSPKPRALMDKIEKRIFGNDGWSPKILYFSTMFILLVK